MDETGRTLIADVFSAHEAAILEDWMKLQFAAAARRGLSSESDLRNQFRQFLNLLKEVLQTASNADVTGPQWQEVRAFLTSMSQLRVRQGFSPVETATFVFSLKQPVFTRLRHEAGIEPARLADLTWYISEVLDGLGLFTTEVYQASREQVIARQQQELLELSTPVVKLWDGILALPLIGTLDSARTQVVMENLLQKVVETGATIAIVDITGVPTVDTLVAQHLLKTVAAARLMGADCIISGIRPQIAQTIVHLGVNLSNVITKATLADAFVVALKRLGTAIGAPGSAAPSGPAAAVPGNGGHLSQTSGL